MFITKFILHGGFTKEDNESNRAFFKELLSDVPRGGTVLFVYFAARDDKEIPEKFAAHARACAKQAEGREFNYVLATLEGFLSELELANVVFIGGGSTNKLLEILRTYPALHSLVRGKTVAGSSAGAYALAAFGASHHEAVVREGLGLAPFRVVCHFESPKLPPNKDSVLALEKTSSNLELVYLKDHEWRAFRYDMS